MLDEARQRAEKLNLCDLMIDVVVARNAFILDSGIQDVLAGLLLQEFEMRRCLIMPATKALIRLALAGKNPDLKDPSNIDARFLTELLGNIERGERYHLFERISHHKKCLCVMIWTLWLSPVLSADRSVRREITKLVNISVSTCVQREFGLKVPIA